MRSLAVALALLFALAGAGCGGDDSDERSGEHPAADPAAGGLGPVHVHGLGIDPRDGALYIATHTGLFRAPAGENKAARVGESQQDVMGFSIPERGRFIGSGHPDPSDAGKPPNLGLIESTDGGENWEQVSLGGEADFHVLRSRGDNVYGFDATNARLMASRDGGRKWTEEQPPGLLVDLAIDPDDPDHVVAAAVQTATGRDGLFESRDGGATWEPLARGRVGLLAWERPDALFVIDGAGSVGRSSDGGTSFEERGQLGGQPAAFVADGGDLYAALGDGTVMASADGGATWGVRSSP